jgi:hypothetical protein
MRDSVTDLGHTFYVRLAVASWCALVINLVVTFGLVFHEIDQTDDAQIAISANQVAACERDNVIRGAQVEAYSAVLASPTANPNVKRQVGLALHNILASPGVRSDGSVNCNP